MLDLWLCHYVSPAAAIAFGNTLQLFLAMFNLREYDFLCFKTTISKMEKKSAGLHGL